MNLFGQLPDQSAASLAPRGTVVGSVWDFVVKGGPVMIPIVLASLVALTVIIERLISLRRSNVIPHGFISNLKVLLDKSGEANDGSLEYCRSNGSPIAKVLEAGIKRLGCSVELLERSVQEAGERVALSLRKHLRALSVVASLAPLLGLLGTVFGMISAFQTVAASADALGKTELLAEGIYEALITTAAGLLVAIPVIICFHWISAKIDGLVAEIDAAAMDFIEECVHDSQSKPDVWKRVAAPMDNGSKSDRLSRAVESTTEV